MGPHPMRQRLAHQDHAEAVTDTKDHRSGAKGAAFDWPAIRAEYEAGTCSVSALSRKHHVSRAAILKRAGKENWGKPSQHEAEIRQRTRSKLSHLENITDPQEQEQAIDAEATRRARVIEQHRDLFTKSRTLFLEAFELRQVVQAEGGKARGGVPAAFEAMKLAKIASEAARNIMLGERIAFGIAEGEERPPADLNEDDRALLERWRSEYAGTGSPPK